MAPRPRRAAPTAVVVEQIKAAVDARRDPALVVIARCDSRPKESLDQVCQRLAAYAAAGADAVGVQLTDVADYRHIGASVATPIVTLWPKAQLSAAEFFSLGFRIALTPSSIPLAAATAARQMLIEMNRQGNDRDYFARQKDLAATESWYKKLGTHRQ
ncbi:MAG: isocitrate lyase/phosphoenolpyruvate mutase family protein [Candidatus Binatia bacterium]